MTKITGHDRAGRAGGQRLSVACLCVALFAAGPACARDYFVAAQGSVQGTQPDGSRGAPWASVQDALRSAVLAGGDRLILGDGAHGRLYIAKASFDPPLQIVAEHAGQAQVEAIRVEASSGLIFQGIGVWPLSPPDRVRPLVATSETARDISFVRMDIRGRVDAPQAYLDWSVRDWTQTWRSSGAVLAGPNNRISQSRLTGIAFGITLSGPDSVAENNVISGFSGDGMRILGDRDAAVGNRIENCVKVDQNHDDGIQSWAPKNASADSRAITGLLLDSNTIIEWTAPPGHPLRCKLQGIGFFDGFYDRAVIRNNLVVVGHYHGITLFGARDTQIVNNTVVHIDTPGRNSPWIKLEDHKSGAPARGNLVANNVAMGFFNPSADKAAMKQQMNAVVQYPNAKFVDPTDFDYRPRPESGYIDAAAAEYAPSRDIRGTARPQGRGPDLGAFEQ